jgi:predicted DNA-binding transcriptional regulator AlpA
VTVSPEPLARILGDLAAIGRKLVETSESALALLERGEAECRPSPRGAGPRAEAKMPTSPTASPSASASALMTRAEVADLLRLGDRTLARLRNDPRAKFPQPIKRARALRWRRGDVEAWIAGRRP